MVFQCGFFNVQLAAQNVKGSFVRQSNTAPVSGDRGIQVGQVMAIEHNFLHVNFGPPHAKSVKKTEVTAFHEWGSF